MDTPEKASSGFTLIELSIVLVVIGLITGGVLVGQDLVRSAGVRATITQIEKYNAAANTFREKYGYLPGDIPGVPAAQFGLIPRGSGQGQGDGNGVIESYANPLEGAGGEALVFWVDLSTARLISGGFSTAVFTSRPGSSAAGATLDLYLPQAKLGGGNYVYVFSGGWGDGAGNNSNGVNYFGVNSVANLGNGACPYCMGSNPGLTVVQASAIDKKIDDGYPTSGNVLAAYIDSDNWEWSGIPYANGRNVPPPTLAVTPSASTCFDNGSSSSNPMQYSIQVSSGNNVNCGLTFKMQAGD